MNTSTLSETTIQPAGHEFLEHAFERGTDYLHGELVASALKLDLPTPSECPFGEEEAKAIKARGNQIIWLPAKDVNGAPITMKKIYGHLENKAPREGKILYKPDWYAGEEFYTRETSRSDADALGSWREVGISAIPGTKCENALRRTITAAEYVEVVVFGNQPPKCFKDMLAEPAKRESEIIRLMNGDKWSKASQMLSDLPFNRHFCDTPVEAMIRVIANQSVNKIRLLENEFSVTATRARVGSLVSFGSAGDGGADVSDWGPQDASSFIGFFLSRSEIAGREL
jgi:hypothetical protein